MRSSALPFIAGAIALCANFVVALAGCGGSDDSDSSASGALEQTSCVRPRTPTDLESFEKMSACELQAIFDGEDVKELTKHAGMPDGPYDGIPLCRKEVLRKVQGSELPRGVREIGGAKLVYELMKASDTLDNSIARDIWHGKLFTRWPGAWSGDVLNFIDITENDINEETRRAAEAKYFVDPGNRFLVLNYESAESGLRSILKHVSVELIRHVYDTARLVDEERGIYLGMAWFVDQPGKYTPEIPGTTAPSCYFALKRHR